ncbi:MAG TPA: hypothetical protein VF815_35240 [Myxococcaceae bacterium]|jgi:hypothetical protein
MANGANTFKARSLLKSEGADYTLITVKEHRAALLRGDTFLGVAAAISRTEFAVLLLPGVTLLRTRKADTHVGEALFAEVQILREKLVLTVNVEWRDVSLTSQQWREAFADDMAIEMESEAFREKLQFLDIPPAFRELPDRVARRYVHRDSTSRLFQDVWLGVAQVNFEVMASVDNPGTPSHRSLDVLVEQAEAFVDRDILRSWTGIEPQ